MAHFTWLWVYIYKKNILRYAMCARLNSPPPPSRNSLLIRQCVFKRSLTTQLARHAKCASEIAPKIELKFYFLNNPQNIPELKHWSRDATFRAWRHMQNNSTPHCACAFTKEEAILNEGVRRSILYLHNFIQEFWGRTVKELSRFVYILCPLWIQNSKYRVNRLKLSLNGLRHHSSSFC